VAVPAAVSQAMPRPYAPAIRRANRGAWSAGSGGATLARRVAATAALLAVACSSGPGDRGASLGPAGAAGGAATTVAPPTTAGPSPVEARDPAALAGELATVEVAIRDPATPPARLGELGRRQQDLYRLLATDATGAEAVRARVPASVAGAVEANLTAGVELRALLPPDPGVLPDWTIVAPPPVEELLAAYRAAEAATGVPWEYLAAIHLVETRFSRIRGNSTAGAQGPMQFLPATWARYGQGGDIADTDDAIAAAGRLLAANGAPDRVEGALRAYNPSDHYVAAVKAYAGVMAADERAILGYHGWQVYYFDTLLPVGYGG